MSDGATLSDLGRRRELLRPVWVPAAWAMGTFAAVRRRWFVNGLLRQNSIGLPVISIGGLTMGGSGKTPVTIYLVRLIQRHWAVRVGLVHGGYRGKARGRVLRVNPDAIDAGRWFGDEPVLLARRAPQAIVVRGPDKVAAARRCRLEGADVVLVDDGFQHLRLARDLDIVLNANAGELPFPLGFAREFRPSRQPRELHWWHHRTNDETGCLAAASGGEDIVSCYKPTVLTDPWGRVQASARLLAGKRVFIVAGIARPGAFREIVERCGARVVGELFVRDHAELTARRLTRALQALSSTPPGIVLCSEKDAARSPCTLAQVGALVLRCRVRLLRGRALLMHALEQVLGHSSTGLR